jgi:hypothetical protein
MDCTQKTGVSDCFYMGLNCSEHASNKDEPNLKQGKAYVNETALKAGGAIYNPTQKQRDVVIFNDLIQGKVSAIKANSRSKLAVSFLVLKVISISVVVTSIASAVISLLPLAFLAAVGAGAETVFAIATLDKIVLCCAIILGISVAVAIVFSLMALGFEKLEGLSDSHYKSYLQDAKLINPMLRFMKEAEEKDKTLKDLLSGVAITKDGIKNTTDTVIKQKNKIIWQYRQFRDKLIEFRDLSKSIPNNTDTEADQAKKIMEAKLYEAEQQKISAEENFKQAVNDLLNLLINNIFTDVVADKETKENIRLSFLNYCNNNQDSLKATLTNIVDNCLLNIHSEPSEIKNAVDDAVSNILSELHNSLNEDKEKLMASNF